MKQQFPFMTVGISMIEKKLFINSLQKWNKDDCWIFRNREKDICKFINAMISCRGKEPSPITQCGGQDMHVGWIMSQVFFWWTGGYDTIKGLFLYLLFMYVWWESQRGLPKAGHISL